MRGSHNPARTSFWLEQACTLRPAAYLLAETLHDAVHDHLGRCAVVGADVVALQGQGGGGGRPKALASRWQAVP